MANPVVDAARQALGPAGVCLPVSFTSNPHADVQRDAVGRLERAGHRAVWTNEVIGKDALVQLALLLSATERMAFGTCIANVWARPAQTMHAAAAQLAQAYPGRFVLGLGVGYPEQAASVGREFGRPLATMREYVTEMDSPTYPPAPDVAFPRIVAANGPKMLALAGDIADGALPAMLPADFTAHARQTLGPDKLLVVGVSMVGDPIDSTAIVSQVCEQLTAGADHVTLLLPIGIEFASGIEQLERLAPALAALPGY
ncbi:LLM class flavin-dependent oxidoreductase [Mycobacterium sp.]|uniref:LLM class flavin-dependent oxidoreductase n=1 Tax=Mycobacterium sp. TaxID=1785 RepID=UPI0039C8C83F